MLIATSPGKSASATKDVVTGFVATVSATTWERPHDTGRVLVAASVGVNAHDAEEAYDADASHARMGMSATSGASGVE